MIIQIFYETGTLFKRLFTCKDCGIKYLSSSEFEFHKQTHYQTHLDTWSSKPDKISWKAPDGLNPALYKVFEKYHLGDRAMLCLWVNGQLNTAIREPARILERVSSVYHVMKLNSRGQRKAGWRDRYGKYPTITLCQDHRGSCSKE
jgi:hypothetical protein